MKIIKIGIILSSISLFSASVHSAELIHSFGKFKAGYADWDIGFDDEERGSLYRLSFEHGAIYDKGDTWFIIEQNKMDQGTDKHNFTMGAVGSYKLFDSNIAVFSKLWNKDENPIGDKFDMTLGLAYSGLNFKNGFFKPFATIAAISTDFTSPKYGSANGLNGYTAGWLAGYSFTIFNQKLSIASSHEFLIDRNDALTHSLVARGHSNGMSGNVALNWNIYKNFGASIAYTYYYNDNGFDGYGDQLAYLLTYQF